jgi:hypothetical protein
VAVAMFGLIGVGLGALVRDPVDLLPARPGRGGSGWFHADRPGIAGTVQGGLLLAGYDIVLAAAGTLLACAGT